MTIQELEDFFKSTELPKTIYINNAEKVIDIQLFLNTSFDQVKFKGETAPAYYRLLKARDYIRASSS
ncbi:hypothetical protein [Pedobacter sp. SYSU D00535]|uniref:DUF6965 family protein n=1 Tax=Pedobacter sp. SYSU D00535 TaxID=2810308 RepID=UPI001A959D4A|nr:hypothetical protein [Pedobacter sp. SYSU D00535]